MKNKFKFLVLPLAAGSLLGCNAETLSANADIEGFLSNLQFPSRSAAAAHLDDVVSSGTNTSSTSRSVGSASDSGDMVIARAVLDGKSNEEIYQSYLSSQLPASLSRSTQNQSCDSGSGSVTSESDYAEVSFDQCIISGQTSSGDTVTVTLDGSKKITASQSGSLKTVSVTGGYAIGIVVNYSSGTKAGVLFNNKSLNNSITYDSSGNYSMSLNEDVYVETFSGDDHEGGELSLKTTEAIVYSGGYFYSGAMTFTIDGETKATAVVDSSGQFNVTYSDGETESVSNSSESAVENY